MREKAGASREIDFRDFCGMKSFCRMQNWLIFAKNRKNPHIFKDFRAFIKILWDARGAWDAARDASASSHIKLNQIG